MAYLTLEDLSFTYPGAEGPALSGIALTVEAGCFLVIGGASGSGKSTLLRLLKPNMTPAAARGGRILLNGEPLEDLSERRAAADIGFVQQNPEAQIVTDTVWHELAFGLESLGQDQATIRRRVAEMASFFGIQAWFDQKTEDLSGGQKQLLNLAAVMVLQPQLLLLDEPTSQLDPMAASEFLAALKKINQEFGTTILLTEHRLEEALPLADQVAVLDHGKLLCTGTVPEVGALLKAKHHRMFEAMPTAMRLWASADTSLPCAVSVREGQKFLAAYADEHPLRELPAAAAPRTQGPLRLEAEKLWFRYQKESADVIRGVSLKVYGGEFLCIVGGNGTGKSTLLRLLGGLRTPYRGRVRAQGRIGVLPQNPQTLFVHKTVFEELEDMTVQSGLSEKEQRETVELTLEQYGLQGLCERHPYDLSGGEQQRLALAKLWLLKPDILLLDEPTKGMDARAKKDFARRLQRLCEQRAAIVMVSHDIEFCAEYADRCALLFDGSLVAEEAPGPFFCGNHFYTTAANRIARELLPTAVTAEQILLAMGTLTEEEDSSDEEPPRRDDRKPPQDEPQAATEASKPLSWGRRIGGSLSGLLAIVLGVDIAQTEHLSSMVSSSGPTASGWIQLGRCCLLILLLLLTGLLWGRRKETVPRHRDRSARGSRHVPKRTAAAIGMLLLMIPLTLWIGVFYLDSKQYYLTAFAVLLECMLPFFLVFEGRRPRARELVLVAVLCALNVAGRAVFFMIPQFKPVLAMTILTGVALGGETGFLVGAVTMLVSNIMFSQGPWTPWQMFAMGLCGFLAGVIYHKGPFQPKRLSLCIFGALCAILVYGGIMNPTSVLLWGSEAMSWGLILSYYITGFPMDCIHAAATVFFLFCIGEPMLKQLERVKEKYGLI